MDFWYISYPNNQIYGCENITIFCVCSIWHCCSLEPPSRKASYAWPPGTPTKLHVQDPNLWMLQRLSINVKKTNGLVYRNFWGTQILGRVSLDNETAFQVVLVVKEGKGRVTKRRSKSCWSKASALTARFFLEWISCFLMHVFLGNWQNIFLSYQENFFGQSRTFLCWRRTFLIRGGLFRLEEDFFRSE